MNKLDKVGQSLKSGFSVSEGEEGRMGTFWLMEGSPPWLMRLNSISSTARSLMWLLTTKALCEEPAVKMV